MKDKYFEILKTRAKNRTCDIRWYHESCLVYKNSIIAFGENKMKSHPFQKRFASNPEAIFLHSEINCLKNALAQYDKEIIKKSTLYVLRVKHDNNNKRNTLGMSKPCSGCSRAIKEYGIKTVYYTNEHGNYERL